MNESLKTKKFSDITVNELIRHAVYYNESEPYDSVENFESMSLTDFIDRVFIKCGDIDEDMKMEDLFKNIIFIANPLADDDVLVIRSGNDKEGDIGE